MPIGPIGPIGPIKKNKMYYTPQDIINENLERRKALAAKANAYNPITGEGCTGDRIRIDLANGAHYVPKEIITVR